MYLCIYAIRICSSARFWWRWGRRDAGGRWGRDCPELAAMRHNQPAWGRRLSAAPAPTSAAPAAAAVDEGILGTWQQQLKLTRQTSTRQTSTSSRKSSSSSSSSRKSGRAAKFPTFSDPRPADTRRSLQALDRPHAGGWNAQRSMMIFRHALAPAIDKTVILLTSPPHPY